VKLPRVLILDDDPDRHSAFARMIPRARLTHAYTAEQAIRSMKNKPTFDLALLDHDLQKSSELASVVNPGDGMVVAEFIASNPQLSPTRVWIHSWNDSARSKMARILRNAGVPVTIQRFHSPPRLPLPCQT